MRTHHNLAEVAGQFKDAEVWPLVHALGGAGIPITPDTPYNTAHYDPIILGFILGRHWEQAQGLALEAIKKDLEYDRMVVRVSPKASTSANALTKKVRGLNLNLDALEFKL